MPPNRIAFLTFLVTEILAGSAIGAWELAHFQCANWPRFLIYVAACLISARLKIRIPNLVATISPAFIPMVLATLQLSFPETVAPGDRLRRNSKQLRREPFDWSSWLSISR